MASVLPFSKQMFEGPELTRVLFGAVIVCLVGAIDDVHELDWLLKLLATARGRDHGLQGCNSSRCRSRDPRAACTVVGHAHTIFFVILATNAVNFVDGLDGLATGIVGIAALSFFVYAYPSSRAATVRRTSSPRLPSSLPPWSACVWDSSHNFHPARIFMGTAALCFGLLLAAAMISITGTPTGAQVSANLTAALVLPLLVPISILLLPVLDVVLAVIRRTRRGQSPFKLDAQHLHHRMLMWGHGHRRAVLLLWFWAAVAAFGWSFLRLPPTVAGVRPFPRHERGCRRPHLLAAAATVVAANRCRHEFPPVLPSGLIELLVITFHKAP